MSTHRQRSWNRRRLGIAARRPPAARVRRDDPERAGPERSKRLRHRMVGTGGAGLGYGERGRSMGRFARGASAGRQLESGASQPKRGAECHRLSPARRFLIRSLFHKAGSRSPETAAVRDGRRCAPRRGRASLYPRRHDSRTRALGLSERPRGDCRRDSSRRLARRQNAVDVPELRLRVDAGSASLGWRGRGSSQRGLGSRVRRSRQRRVHARPERRDGYARRCAV